MRLSAVICALSASAACTLSGAEDAVGILAPGEPAQLTIVTVGVAGGIASEERTRLDSASGLYTYAFCRPGTGASGTCLTPQRTNVATAAVVAQVFSMLTSPEMRRVKSSYSPVLLPPDPHVTTYDFTVNGRRRAVTIARGATGVPPILARLQCQLRVAGGDLISCA